MKLTTKIIAGLILLVGGLILVRIVLSNMFSIDGIALSQMNTQISSLDRENMLLKEKIYTASSYTTIASDAATMGFVEETSQISLSNASSIAIRQ